MYTVIKYGVCGYILGDILTSDLSYDVSEFQSDMVIVIVSGNDLITSNNLEFFFNI